MERSSKHWQRNQHYVIPFRFLNKNVTVTLDARMVHRARVVGQFFGIIVLTGFIVYTLLVNVMPFGAMTRYSLSGKEQGISDLGPKERVTISIKDGQKIFHQTHDLVYFTTPIPLQFDKATVKVVYQNPDSDQLVDIGFQDEEKWHYDTKPLDVPFLNTLSWNITGSQPALYQRERQFDSADAFIAHPSQDALLGTLDYEFGIGPTSQLQLPDYKPQSKETIIDTPLRGKHIFYVYLHNEPFRMRIQKQDLNWYEDPDVMTVKIYKDKDLVYQASVDDDGIQDASGTSKSPQELLIKNPGKELPENGVYKIVVDANGDTIIKRISTNLHKIIFQGSLFPASNREQYHSIVASTSATTVYTNALALSALSYHTAGLQDIAVGDQMLRITRLSDDQIITPQAAIEKVIVPKNDIVLSAYQGFFAFEPDQFFVMSSYHSLPITKKEDISMVDYILTDYTKPRKDGDWQVNEIAFDIRGAYIQNGKLSWVISAPHLDDNKREFIIKDIEIRFEKQSWM